MKTIQTRIKVYETVEEMTAAADRAFRSGRSDCGDPFFARPSFVGRAFTGWEEAKAAANSTWDEGVELLQQLGDLVSERVQTQPKSRKRRAAWSEDGGDEIDIDRVRSGQAPWRTCVRQQVRGQQTITIVANVGAPATRGAEEMMWRGAAALVLGQLLEDAGYRVELYAARMGMRTFRCGDNFFCGVKAKRADQPLDLATLANVVSGWFYRTVFFQMFFAQGLAVASSLGLSRAFFAGEVEAALPQITEPIIVDNLWSMEEAAVFVNEALARFQ